MMKICPCRSNVTICILLMTCKVQGSILEGHVWKDRFFHSIPLCRHNIPSGVDKHFISEAKLDDFDDTGTVSFATTRIGSIHVNMDSNSGWLSLNNEQTIKDNYQVHSPTASFNGRKSLNSHDQPQSNSVSVSLDVPAFFRLLLLLCSGAASFSTAFMGTLRLLAPMIFARKLLVFVGDIINDYMTGRYFRTTYTRLERTYLLYYETPSAFRALCRITAQITIYFSLSSIMAWFVGIRHPPCHGGNGSLASFCALLWISTVVGIGHAFSTAISIWGGPIRLQAKLHPPRPRNSLNTFLARPWRVIHWMKNPEAFINMMATPEVEMVEMKPEIFPITWISLRLLLMYAVAKVASTEPNKCNWCIKERNIIRKLMNSYFVQLALCDEWYRVFVIEKRVGLGITVISGALIAMISLLCFCAKINPTATLLLIPSSIALVTSSVMNVLIYLDQVNTKRGKIKR